MDTTTYCEAHCKGYRDTGGKCFFSTCDYKDMKERIATEGYWLTQASIDDEANRTFVRKVAGFGDLDSLFVEWTDEQKAAWEAEHPAEPINE